jgi:hypothetical protein
MPPISWQLEVRACARCPVHGCVVCQPGRLRNAMLLQVACFTGICAQEGGNNEIVYSAAASRQAATAAGPVCMCGSLHSHCARLLSPPQGSGLVRFYWFASGCLLRAVACWTCGWHRRHGACHIEQLHVPVLSFTVAIRLALLSKLEAVLCNMAALCG